MALKRISDYTSAGALAGTEILEVETAAGTSLKTTAAAIAALGGGATPPGQLVGINNQTGTTYTPVLGDAGKDISCNNAAAITLTVPPNSSVAYPIGTFILFSQAGTGAVTAAAGAGVTLNAANGFATTARYDVRALEKVATDQWRVL